MKRFTLARIVFVAVCFASQIFVATASAATLQLVSVTPSSGSGSSAAFTATVASSAGGADIGTVNLVVNDVLYSMNACAVTYETSTGLLYLYKDDFTTGYTSGTIGSNATLSNSQCSINLSRVTATASGNNLVLSIPVTFTAIFAGTKNIYLRATNSTSVADYTQMGTWTVMQSVSAPSAPILPGGRFMYSYPNFFTGAPGVGTPEGYVQRFAGAKLNPLAFTWFSPGQDIRQLNPSGEYYKHVNLRTINSEQQGPNGSLYEGRPDYQYIHTYHPEWLVKDASGNTISMGLATDEMLDFGNDAYLDWALNTWLPNQLFDAIDKEPGRTIFLQQDNGYFYRMYYTPAPNDPASARYVTDEGVQTAWIHYLSRLKTRWPNAKVIINSSALGYIPQDTQIATFQRILSVADGYYSEFLTDRHTYFSGTGSSGDYKRLFLKTTMALASWLADNNKVFMPHDGLGDQSAPSQDDTNYSWAFFNLMRQGDRQYYSKVTLDSSGMWVPANFPEMDLALGNALENAVEFQPNVFRRTFEQAIAYVNMSDGTVSINLPTGSAYKNSLGQPVASPLVLPSFSGLTVYRPVPNPTVQLVSVTPSSGSGSSTTLLVTVASSAGAADVTTVNVVINDILYSMNACAVTYEASSHLLYLYKDDFTTGYTSGTIGSNAILSNSQCSINLAGVAANASGSNLTLNLPVTFSANFAGTKNVYLRGTNSTSVADYTQMGTWIVTAANNPPAIISTATATPNSGTTGATISFSVGAGDPDGDALSYQWNFGDGSSGTGASAAHAYSSPGTYTAVVLVSDGMGGSAQSSVTVTISAVSNTVHVKSIILSIASSAGNSGKSARSVVTIMDSNGAPAAGATVSGHWSGLVTADVSGITDSTGAVTFTSAKTKQSGTFTFTIKNIVAAGYTYDSAKNAVTSLSITTSGIVTSSAVAATSNVLMTSSGSGAVSLGSVSINQMFKLRLPLPEQFAHKTQFRAKTSGLSAAVRLRQSTISGRIGTAGPFTFTVQFTSKDASARIEQQYTISVVP
jgi:hypothetical protein